MWSSPSARRSTSKARTAAITRGNSMYVAFVSSHVRSSSTNNRANSAKNEPRPLATLQYASYVDDHVAALTAWPVPGSTRCTISASMRVMLMAAASHG